MNGTVSISTRFLWDWKIIKMCLRGSHHAENHQKLCSFALFTIIIQAFFGLVFADFFIRKLKFASFYRIIFYIPVIATPAIVGNIFSKIFETNRGYLNVFLRFLHLDGLCQQWLADPKWALACIIFVNIWQWTGYSMLMYYANMLNIPQDLYEAATIDGAGQIQQFAKITFPLSQRNPLYAVHHGNAGIAEMF